MSLLQDPDGNLADFLSDVSSSFRSATEALAFASRALAASSLDGEDYRAVERALNRAGNAATVAFV